MMASVVILALCAVGGVEPSCYQTPNPDPLAGGWCWFQDPRACYYAGAHHRTYFGWVDNDSPDNADIMVAYLDHDQGITSAPITVRNDWSVRDDHDAPAIVPGLDGKILIFYTKHPPATTAKVQMQRSASPEDISSWGNTVEVTSEYSCTYPNLVRTSDDRLWLFYRFNGDPDHFKTRFRYSDDDGTSWVPDPSLKGVTLIDFHDRSLPDPYKYNELYIKVAARGDQIHIAGSRCDHNPPGSPGSYRNIYWFYYDGARWKTHDGELNLPVTESSAELVFESDDYGGGNTWIWDVAVDSSNNPVIVFAHNINTLNHQYYSAVWNGSSWDIAKIGDSNRGGLSGASSQYSPGVCLDHEDPHICYCSVKPPGQNYLEIHKFQYDATGNQWIKVEEVTSLSTADNLRPVVPRGSQPPCKVMWMNGTYVSYTNYPTAIKWGY